MHLQTHQWDVFLCFELFVNVNVFSFKHSFDFKAPWAQTDESLMRNLLKIKSVFNFDFALASLVLSLVVKLTAVCSSGPVWPNLTNLIIRPGNLFMTATSN